jgi:hypothetical protein
MNKMRSVIEYYSIAQRSIRVKATLPVNHE